MDNHSNNMISVNDKKYIITLKWLFLLLTNKTNLDLRTILYKYVKYQNDMPYTLHIIFKTFNSCFRSIMLNQKTLKIFVIWMTSLLISFNFLNYSYNEVYS